MVIKLNQKQENSFSPQIYKLSKRKQIKLKNKAKSKMMKSMKKRKRKNQKVRKKNVEVLQAILIDYKYKLI